MPCASDSPRPVPLPTPLVIKEQIERPFQHGARDARLVSAQANAALARTTAKRWQQLVKSGAVSRQEVDMKNGDLAAKRATPRRRLSAISCAPDCFRHWSSALSEHAIAARIGESASGFSIAPRPVELALQDVPVGASSTLLERLTRHRVDPVPRGRGELPRRGPRPRRRPDPGTGAGRANSRRRTA